MLVKELLAGCLGGFVLAFLQFLFGVDDSAGLKGDVGGVPKGGVVPFRFWRGSKELLFSRDEKESNKLELKLGIAH